MSLLYAYGISPKDMLTIWFFSFFFSSSNKTPILEAAKLVFFVDKVSFTLHPWIRLIDTNTNAKEQKLNFSVSFQNRALNSVVLLPEWKKKVEVFQFLPITMLPYG